MTKSIEAVKQPNGLWTVTTVQTTVETDVMCNITDKTVPIPPIITPIPPKPPTAGWTLKSNFDDGVTGTKAESPTGITEAFSLTVISADRSFSGKKSAKMGIKQGTDGWGDWGGILSHTKKCVEGDELWFRVRSFFPTNFVPVAFPRLKFLRVHTAEGHIDLYILPNGGFAYNNEITGFSTAENNTTGKPSPFGDPIQKDVWETYEMYIKFHSQPGKGTYRVWKNGKKMYEDMTQKTLSSTLSYSEHSNIFTYWNSYSNGGAPATQFMYMDDVVLTTSTPSERDEFGNPMIGIFTS